MCDALGACARSVRAGEVAGVSWRLAVWSMLRGKTPRARSAGQVPRRRVSSGRVRFLPWNSPHPPGARQPNHEPRRGRTDPRAPDRVRSAYRDVRKARAGLIPRGRRRHREARRPRARRDHRRPKLLPSATIVLPSTIAAPNARADPVDLAPFVGKAGFFIRYPAGWVRATDRPGTDNGKSETLALVGNFKDIDTVSVEREPMALHRDFAEAAAAGGDDAREGGDDAPEEGRRGRVE